MHVQWLYIGDFKTKAGVDVKKGTTKSWNCFRMYILLLFFFALEVYCQFVESLTRLILFMWSSLIVFVGISHFYVTIFMFRHIVACKHCQVLLSVNKKEPGEWTCQETIRQWRKFLWCSHTVRKRDSLLQGECVNVPTTNTVWPLVITMFTSSYYCMQFLAESAADTVITWSLVCYNNIRTRPVVVRVWKTVDIHSIQYPYNVCVSVLKLNRQCAKVHV